MRPVSSIVWCAAALFSVILGGCGYAGEPKPPALGRPLRVTNLSAIERGSKIVVTFMMPVETTDALPVPEHPDVELRVGVVAAPWNEAAWQASSDRVPVAVPEMKPPPRIVPVKAAKATTKPLPRGSSGARGGSASVQPVGSSGSAKAASGATRAKRTKATSGSAKSQAKMVPPIITASIDAAKYAGKTVVVGVRVHGERGRDDGMATVRLEVLPVLPVPVGLKAVDVANTVHLQWTANAPAFRIFRRQPADTDWVRVGETTQGAYDDVSFEYGKTWQYYVQSIRKVGEGVMESEPSETYTFTPVDHFPPAVPTGLTVISGTKTVEISWDGVADKDLAGYRIYRNGLRIADGLQTTAYSDKEVTLGSKYSYQISAVDLAGNESKMCPAQEVTME